MGINTIHKLDVIQFAGPSYLTQIKNQKWNAGIESLVEHPSGFVYPMFRANQSQDISTDFTTTQLASLLALTTMGGVAPGAISTFFKLGAQTGNASRGSGVHERLNISASLIYVQSIRLPHNGAGEAQVMIVPQYDGVNDPFVYAGSIALPSNLTALEYFGAGPVSINGTAVPGVQEINIDFGVELIKVGGESDEFNTFIGINKCVPTVTIRTLQRTNWELLGLRGIALDADTGLTFYGRKFAQGGSRVANATAQHLKFVALNGSAIPMDSNGEENNPITDTLKIEPISGSDSVIPLTYSVAAIT